MEGRKPIDDELLAALDALDSNLKASSRMEITKGALIDDLKALNFLAPWASNGFLPIDPKENGPSR